ncbi:MAG: MaoC family dehydratase [Acidimicrobiales bacterium]|nr:MaoC family dehydratase [Acidimicrobiales bacterium]
MTINPARCTRIAVADPPEVSDANPIHDEKAKEYGYAGGIVAGIHTYGWMVPAILDSLGEEWLAHGWCEFRLPRPVYVGDELLTQVVPSDHHPGVGLIKQTAVNDERITIEGYCGLGDAPWRDEFLLPSQRSPQPEAVDRPFLNIDQIPTNQDYPAMSVPLAQREALAWMSERIHDDDPMWISGASPRVHPSWLLGQMTPLIRHSYRMPAGIHASGRVQHLKTFEAKGDVSVAGRWGDLEVRKGKPWSTTDAVFTDCDGSDVALVRQVAVILPPLGTN